MEFNPDLALRNISEFKSGNRKIEECIAEPLEEGVVYKFLKEGQRCYWFFGEVPLIETKGNQNLSRPLAAVTILSATHFLENNKVYTKGEYKVVKIIKEGEIYFNGFGKK